MASVQSSVLNASAITTTANPGRRKVGPYRLAALAISLVAWWVIVEAILTVSAMF
jgi:hypothetical protein